MFYCGPMKIGKLNKCNVSNAGIAPMHRCIAMLFTRYVSRYTLQESRYLLMALSAARAAAVHKLVCQCQPRSNRDAYAYAIATRMQPRLDILWKTPCCWRNLTEDRYLTVTPLLLTIPLANINILICRWYYYIFNECQRFAMSNWYVCSV